MLFDTCIRAQCGGCGLWTGSSSDVRGSVHTQAHRVHPHQGGGRATHSFGAMLFKALTWTVQLWTLLIVTTYTRKMLTAVSQMLRQRKSPGLCALGGMRYLWANKGFLLPPPPLLSARNSSQAVKLRVKKRGYIYHVIWGHITLNPHLDYMRWLLLSPFYRW